MSARTLLITRPRAEAEALMQTLAAEGWASIAEPLLEITMLPAELPDLSRFRALVFTSAQAVAAFAGKTRKRDLPVYAVGLATEVAARKTGFADIRTATGNVAALNRLLAEERSGDQRPLLHISGVHIADQVRAPGAPVERLPLYDARAAMELSPSCLDALDRTLISGVLLFSPRTGKIFAELLKKYARTQLVSTINALCLSDTVIESIRHLPWRNVQAAAAPDTAGMIALLKGMESK
jgi:uroporphyrinogen-III synthase